MSTISPLSTNHSLYSNTQSIVTINKNDLLPTSENILHRLYEQKLRLIQVYDLEIQRQQSTVHLNTFLDKIDQIIHEYENQESSKKIKLNLNTKQNLYILDNTTKHLDDVIYSTYFHGKIV